MGAWDVIKGIGSAAVDTFVPEVVQEAAAEIVPESVQEVAHDVVDAGGSLATGVAEAAVNPVGAAMDLVTGGGADVGGAPSVGADVGGFLETLGNVAAPVLGALEETALPGAKAIPLIGNGINAVQGAYHVGSAVYDGLTGDRDGAIAHGTQAAFNGLGCVPGLNTVLGATDVVLGTGGAVAKTYGATTDHPGDYEDVPQSCGDVAAGGMVQLTNALFGKDDSNWIAEGDKATGTRRGEIGAGLGAAGGMILCPPLAPLLGTIGAATLHKPLGDFAGSIFGVDPDAPTSGAGKPTAAQRHGQAENRGEPWRLYEDQY